MRNIPQFFIIFYLLALFGCAKEPQPDNREHFPDISREDRVNTMKYVIQVGAFADIDNAIRLTDELERIGLQAYYFVHESGLYKVQFGNYPSFQEALQDAEEMFDTGQISDYYIVKPEEFVAARQFDRGEEFVRKNIIATAERFLGIPYKWGGQSSETGFDCSGLSMVVYKINGIDLPRNSRSQFNVGRNVQKSELRKGDLVFFATNGGKRVSHVGIYKGDGNFIHAPKKGKKIEVTSLESYYFKSRFVGAKTYL